MCTSTERPGLSLDLRVGQVGRFGGYVLLAQHLSSNEGGLLLKYYKVLYVSTNLPIASFNSSIAR